MDCAEEFFAVINTNTEIRPYLKSYPFTADNIDIGIFFIDPQGDYLRDPHIGIARIARGEINYSTSIVNEEGRSKDKSQITETYQEALEALKKEG